ncbi:MAG TPA: DivIVA domain-containing protein [Actinobacteria bacterium]|nr:DivIVA domain-containing protein [Actinomycetota bacterium]
MADEQGPRGLDPAQIRSKRFEMTRRGFDPQQVTAFLDEVAQEVARLRRLVVDLEGRLEEARAKVADVLAAEEALQLTILTATKARDEMLARARREAAEILAEAQREAARLRDSARA